MKNILLLLFIVIKSSSLAQAPNWLNSKRFGNQGNDITNANTTDSNGNYFIVGSYDSASVSFDNYTLNNSGNNDIFIVKYDQTGTVLWAKTAIGNGSDVINAISTDQDNNIIITGFFESSTIMFGNTTLTNTGGKDIFAVKYDSSGNLLWAKSFGGDSNEEANSICSDSFGNIYITGYYKSFIISTTISTITNNGGKDIFLSKYDSSGNLIWLKTYGGIYDDWGISLIKDKISNGIFLCGNFNSDVIDFQSNTILNTNSAGNTEDIFAIKFDYNGTILWVKKEGGTLNDIVYNATVDNNGCLILVGYFYNSTLNFGTVPLQNAGGNKMFVGKFDSNGNVLWAKTVGWIGGNNYATNVSTDSTGSILIGGYYEYNPFIYATWAFSNYGGTDIFLMKFNSTGDIQWAKNIAGSGNETITSISCTSLNKFIVLGNFDSATLGFGTNSLINSGQNDIWVSNIPTNYLNIPTFETELFSVYPNPTKDFLHIYTENELSGKITDLTGKTLMTINTKDIDVSSLSAGIYLLDIVSDDKRYVSKIVKE
jgi:hypothetical protein